MDSGLKTEASGGLQDQSEHAEIKDKIIKTFRNHAKQIKTEASQAP